MCYKNLIIEKVGNIGALTSFLRNSKNIEILNYLESNIPDFTSDMKLSEKIWYFINDVKEEQRCKCGELLIFTGPKNGYRTSCGNKECYIKNRTETLRKNTIYVEKIIKTKVDKPKKEIISKSDNFIDNWFEQDDLQVFEKKKVDRVIDSNSLYYMTYDIDNNLPENLTMIKSSKLDNNLKLSCCNCGKEFDIIKQLLLQRKRDNIEICLNCNPIKYEKTQMELDLISFIKENYKGEVLTNVKDLISDNIDIYLPEFKLALEFNELYWHCELFKNKNYHLNKTKECLSNGISLFHIWEDDWNKKSIVIKSMILNKIGKSIKIYARKCEVRVVDDNTLIRTFIDANHIQGFVGSMVKLGLFHENELVSLVTFGSLRRNMGLESKDGYYELLRFCSKLNYSIVGGASKLFDYFVKNYNPINVISYSDYSRSIGNMYDQLGFKLEHLSDPNYYYIVDNKRVYRYNFRKDVLIKKGFDGSKTEVEIMHEQNLYRLFDSGMQRWCYDFNK